MTDTFRALCVELLDELVARPLILGDLIDRTRNALSQTPFEDKMEKNSSNSLPKNYIDPEHCGEDRNLLETFYTACKSEGGTSDEITLRGLRAVLSKWGCPTPPAEGDLTDEELLRAYGKARRDYCYDGPIDDWPTRAERAATIAGLRAVEAAVIARRPAPVPQPARCPLCDYQYGHQIGCENNPVDIALAAAHALPLPSGDSQHQQFAPASAAMIPMEYVHLDFDGRIVREPSEEGSGGCWRVLNSRFVSPFTEFPTAEAACNALQAAQALPLPSGEVEK